jgi:hypothetical protein
LNVYYDYVLGLRPIGVNLRRSPADQCPKNIQYRTRNVEFRSFLHFCGSIFLVRYSIFTSEPGNPFKLTLMGPCPGLCCAALATATASTGSRGFVSANGTRRAPKEPHCNRAYNCQNHPHKALAFGRCFCFSARLFSEFSGTALLEIPCVQ